MTRLLFAEEAQGVLDLFRRNLEAELKRSQ